MTKLSKDEKRDIDTLNGHTFFNKKDYTPYPTAEEKKIVKKALDKRKQNFKQFKYVGLEDLYEAIRFNYPKAASVIVLNLDECDIESLPRMNVKKIRSVVVLGQHKNLYSKGRCVSSEYLGCSLMFDVAVCMVKHGVVNVKIMKIKGGSTA
jgi:hypothetical protein